jgi:flagellar biosynthesis protein FlhB
MRFVVITSVWRNNWHDIAHDMGRWPLTGMEWLGQAFFATLLTVGFLFMAMIAFDDAFWAQKAGK